MTPRKPKLHMPKLYPDRWLAYCQATGTAVTKGDPRDRHNKKFHAWIDIQWALYGRADKATRKDSGRSFTRFLVDTYLTGDTNATL